MVLHALDDGALLPAAGPTDTSTEPRTSSTRRTAGSGPGGSTGTMMTGCEPGSARGTPRRVVPRIRDPHPTRIASILKTKKFEINTTPMNLNEEIKKNSVTKCLQAFVQLR